MTDICIRISADASNLVVVLEEVLGLHRNEHAYIHVPAQAVSRQLSILPLPGVVLAHSRYRA